MILRERITQYIEQRREKILKGEVNCIPTSFRRFSEVFPGIEQGKMYLFSGASKSSKTQIMNYMIIYNTVLYAYYHPNIIIPKIFYYPLEETKENITLRFICYLLYTLYNIRVSPLELTSTYKAHPIDPAIINLVKSEKISKILDFYEECITFASSRNPTGIWRDIVDYAKNNGTIYSKEYQTKDIDGTPITKQAFDYYEPTRPNEYVMFIVDHVSLLDSERGFTLKQTIDKLCEYFVIARNHYNYIPIVIQQQNIESIGLDAFKANKIRPTQAGLADSKDTGKAADVMFGITNPFNYEMSDYLGYNIKLLKGNFRCLEIVLNRHGESNVICPLYFDGAINYYKELPKPNDTAGINDVYTKVMRELRGKAEESKETKITLLNYTKNKLFKLLKHDRITYRKK